MSETPSTPPVESLPPPDSSLFSRLTDVFVTPGRLFTELKTAQFNSSNWLVPLALTCIVGIAASWIMLSQETVLRSIRDEQHQQIQKQVDAGKMTKEQADKAKDMMERFTSPTLMKVAGSVGSVFANVAVLFAVALVMWLLGAKVFHGQFDFMKALEASGLASMVNLIGGLVTTLLVVIQGRMLTSLGPVLFIREPDMTNPMHRVLAAINLLSLWYVVVLAIALARLSGGSLMKSALWLFVIWAAVTFGSLAISFAFASR